IQGNLIVLVFHSENPEGERVKTVMEANLIIETDSGFISVPGRCLSNSEGSDVLFNISGVMGEINGIPLTRYGVEIISLQYEIPRLTMNLDLSRAKNEPSAKKVEAELAVWEAFISRLDYKSGMIGFEEITGFTEEILNDRGLMRNYAQNNSEGVPMGAAQIVGGVFAEGNKFLAVVDEEWVLFNKGAEEYFARTHKIIAELKSDGWVIIEDIIG
ncbi:MAG: hypothetical protein FWF03_02595, partial [Defluviitaleaceae bacterium]|nr:hypothetical protein [Defluviitaleaceae bacterium]